MFLKYLTLINYRPIQPSIFLFSLVAAMYVVQKQREYKVQKSEY